MTGGVVATVFALLPIVAVVVLLVLLKRIADGVDRLGTTVERRLLHIEQRLGGPGGDGADPRWPDAP